MTSAGNSLSLSQRLTHKIQADTDAKKALGQIDSTLDNLLYMGNWHDSTPRALVLDPLLQSTDKCVYLLLRTYLSATGASRMPSYDEIGRLLGLSRGTIARCLHILRASRWITLCNALRHEQTGQFKGNTYAIHDEPLSIEEAMVLDGRYIEALEDLEKKHRHPRVRLVARVVLDNLRFYLNRFDTEQPDSIASNYEGKTVSRFLNNSAYSSPSETNPKIDSVSRVQKLNPVKTPVQSLDLGAKNKNNDEKQSFNNRVQKIDADEQKIDSVEKACSSSYINNINNIKTTTTTQSMPKNAQRAGNENNQPPDPGLIWPNDLSGDARWVAWQSLRKCPEQHRQDILDEVAARMSLSGKNQIKNPAGWLAWASKELREEGVFPITNLGIRHRERREREQQRMQDDTEKKNVLAQQGAMLATKNRLDSNKKPPHDTHKRHVAALRASLHGLVKVNEN